MKKIIFLPCLIFQQRRSTASSAPTCHGRGGRGCERGQSQGNPLVSLIDKADWQAKEMQYFDNKRCILILILAINYEVKSFMEDSPDFVDLPPNAYHRLSGDCGRG